MRTATSSAIKCIGYSSVPFFQLRTIEIASWLDDAILEFAIV
jgi:hypothetical protein